MYKAEIKEIILYLNEKSGREFKINTKNSSKLITDELKRGGTVDNLKNIVDMKVKQWLGNGEMEKYLRPDTLFMKKNIKKYSTELKFKIRTTVITENKELDYKKKYKDQRDFNKIESEYKRFLELLSSMPYEQYLRTRHWKHFKAEALKFFNFKCQLCSGDELLSIHHNTYENRGKETFNDVTCLCKKCHKKFHEIHNEKEG